MKHIAIVGGAIANKPFNGGAAWTRLSYVLGLRKLGFDVYFVEQLADPPSEQVRTYFEGVMSTFGLTEYSALLSPMGTSISGLDDGVLDDVASSAAMLLNLSGHLALDEPIGSIPHKVYVDLDPGFTQSWQRSGAGAARLEGHDFFFSVGHNIGKHECTIPSNGIQWRPLLQPVVLDHWPVAQPSAFGHFTTVASWRGPFGPIEVGDRTLGSKVREFRKYITLPGKVDATFEIALDIHPGDLQDRILLLENGWRIADPKSVTACPSTFREYVQGSMAEFSVAQEIYVQTQSGWFSDRTVRYLASGKPAVVQDTGFRHNLPTGQGLIAFGSMEEAVAGARAVIQNYQEHSKAARQIAETYFDSTVTLGKLIEEIGVCP